MLKYRASRDKKRFPKYPVRDPRTFCRWSIWAGLCLPSRRVVIGQETGEDGNLVMENGGELSKHFENMLKILGSHGVYIRNSYTIQPTI